MKDRRIDLEDDILMSDYRELEQENKQQQELIDKIKEISLGEIDEAYLEERKMSERIEDVLDLIKEYEVNECIFWQFKCRSIS